MSHTVSDACLAYLRALIAAQGPTAGFGEQKDLQASLLDLRDVVKDVSFGSQPKKPEIDPATRSRI